MPFDLSREIVARWEDGQPAHLEILKQAGVQGVFAASADPSFKAACEAGGIRVAPFAELQTLKLSDLGSTKPRSVAALADGLWPGIRRPPNVAGRGDETASASREPWVDSNGYLIEYLRALYPDRPACLGYTPEQLGDRGVPYDTLELALIEAWVAGGNYVLAMEKDYRAALLRKDGKALEALQQLGTTTRWLRENISLFRQSCPPAVTALVEPGTATVEISNLLYRRNASPVLAAASNPPSPQPETLAVVAANLREPAPAVSKQILRHAEAGSIVVVANPSAGQWWRSPVLKPVRSEPDREFFSLGKGQLVAYRKPIADPSEFALDVIDLIGHRRRAVRIWNGPAVIALTTNSPKRGERLVHLINYGSPIDTDIQTRVQGQFTKATLLRPNGSPLPLKASKRGTMTEVQVPELKRLGVLVFS